MPHCCPRPEHPGELDTIEDLLIHVLGHTIHLEDLMTEANTDQARLDADVQAETAAVTQLGTNLQNQIDALKAVIASNPTAPVSSINLAGFDALVQSTQAAATAAAPASIPTVNDGDTSVAGAPVPAGDQSPSATVQALDATGKPLYQHLGGNPVDVNFWPLSVLHAEDGTQLYTYANDTGNTATGASADWLPYTGTAS